MFCPNCGTDVPKNSNFCPTCGKNLKNVEIIFRKKENENIQINKMDSKKATEQTTVISKIKAKKPSNCETRIFSPDEINDFNNLLKEKDLENNKIQSKEIKIVNNDSNTINSEKEPKKKKFSLKEKWNNFINEDDAISIFSKSSYDESKLDEAKEPEEIQIPIQTDLQNEYSKKDDLKSDFEEKTAEIYNKLTPKSFTEKVNAEIAKQQNEEEKSEKISFYEKIKPEKGLKFKRKKKKEVKVNISNNLQNENKDEESKLFQEENKLTKKLKENFDFSEDNNTNKNSKIKFYSFMDQLLLKIQKLNKLVQSKGKKSLIIFIIIGIIISFIPMIIGAEEFSISLITLLSCKLLFNYLEFYFSLYNTTEKVWVESSDDEVKIFALINWFICQLFLFIAYFLSPWEGLFNFELLPALTPLPIATIILFIIAIIISMAEYWPQLKNENKINFIGWYAIPFILIHFIAKIFFVIANLIV